MSKLIAFEEISNKISDAEYSSFLERQKRRGYFNDANTDQDGNPIDVNDYILTGMDILIEATTEE
jgi:hypothetical protein